MIIALKTDSDTAQLLLLESDGSIIAQDDWEAGRQLSGQLLAHMKELLKRQNANWDSLSGVVVYRGPGSFTGLRIGITVANTMAYAKHLPIVGTLGKGWIADGCERLRQGSNDTQVLPEYGGEPNITKPKQ